MTTQPAVEGPDAQVYELRPKRSRHELEVLAEPLDTHYEVELDDPPPSGRTPEYVDGTADDGRPAVIGEERRPVIPASLKRGHIGSTVKRSAGRTSHRVRYHGIRSPWYGILSTLWTFRGIGRTARRTWRWVMHSELSVLLQEAANANNVDKGPTIEKQLAARRKSRALMLLGIVFAVLVGILLLAALTPWWAQLLTLLGVVTFLGWTGRPIGKALAPGAVITHRFRKLDSDTVLRAYYKAGLGDPEKPGQQIKFPAGMQGDGQGARVLVDLPYGKGLGDAIKAKAKLASGLDVSLSQVFISRDKSSHRRHELWVAHEDPLAKPAGRTPLLRLQQTDIWQPAPFGLDERGMPVTVDLMWRSLMFGAQPRAGKTFSARGLALFAALDPYVKLTVFDASGKPDWRRFSLVADRCGFGLAMTRDGDPIDLLLDALRELKADVEDRYQRLSMLPVEVCPEAKLTREIARDKRYRMPVRMVVLDEFQEYFELGEQSKEIASLLVYLCRVAPAAGVILVDATQRPSGIGGAGNVGTQFTSFRDNHQIRFSLRTPSWQVSDLVLGAGAYSEGLDSSLLLPEYKGVGILRGASDASPTVRTYLADAQDAERILTAARAVRHRAGTLTGMAAGEYVARHSRDVLADARSTFYAGEAQVSWQALAARLAEQIPEHYADVTPRAISDQLRALGVESLRVRTPGSPSGEVLRGPKALQIDEAMAQRQITDGRP